MTNLIISEIAIFAERFSISHGAAYTLPTVFEQVAEMVDKPVREIISQATYTNKPLGEYIKQIALQVA